MQKDVNRLLRKKEVIPPVQQKEDPKKTMSPPPFALKAEPMQKKEGPQQAKETASSGPSTALPEAVRDKMENAIGMDFSNVKVHPNSEKAVQAGALAYTQGAEIHFAPGQYNPTSHQGQELLGHELAHTKQQAEGRVQSNGEVAGMPLNNERSLEKEADEIGAKAAQGVSAGAPAQRKQAKADGNAPAQRFKMREEDIAKYPKFTQFMAQQMPGNINDPRLQHYLEKFGQNTGETKRDIRSDLAWGSGPEVRPYSMSANKVSFVSNAGSDVIRISRDAIEGFEKNQTLQQNFHRLVLESNVLSGYTQFLDDQDGKDYYGKEGKLLEKAEFGLDIENVWDAKDARRGKFGKGEWELTVVSAQGPNPQRIRLWNSANADGHYDAKPGTTISVQSGGYDDWLIRTQYLPAGKNPSKDGDYKNGEMLTNKVGKDEYMVRSEHTGDGDRQDLVLKVVRKSTSGSR